MFLTSRNELVTSHRFFSSSGHGAGLKKSDKILANSTMVTTLVYDIIEQKSHRAGFCTGRKQLSFRFERKTQEAITRQKSLNPVTIQFFLRFSPCSVGKQSLKCSVNSQHLPKEKEMNIKSSWGSVNFVLSIMNVTLNR